MRFQFAMLFLAGCGRFAFDPIEDDGLVVSFAFEDSFADDSGNHTATCSSCPTFVAGRTGSTAARFTGGECLVIADDLVFHALAFTMTAWVNLDVADADTMFAKSFDDNATGNNSWELWFPGDTSAQFSTVESGDNVYLTSDQVTPGTWRHYAGTLDASGKRFYVDGVERASDTAARGTAYDNGAVRIGCDKDAGTETGRYKGLIDDVRFYTRALSAAEITELAR